MKGTYFLLVRLPRRTTVRGMVIPSGRYIYVGSGMRSIEDRVKRHIRSAYGKTLKKHWHIDYLLSSGAQIENIFVKESAKKEECEIARKLSKHYGCVKGFGSSDCNCPGHLFIVPSQEDP